MEIHYFAAARAAAGRSSEVVDEIPATLGELLDARATALTGHTAAGMPLSAVLERCTFLVDGRRSTRSTPLDGATRIDALPPFAGG